MKALNKSFNFSSILSDKIIWLSPRQKFQIIRKCNFFNLHKDYKNDKFLDLYYNKFDLKDKDDAIYNIEIECNFNPKQKEDLPLNFERILKIIKQNHILLTEGAFKYNFYLEFKAVSYFKPILNRKEAYEDLIEHCNTRIEKCSPSKDGNPLAAIATIPGGGKTLFLRSIPFYFSTIDNSFDYLPIYITFNNSTPVDDDLIINDKTIINARILFSFIEGIKKTPCNYNDSHKTFKFSTFCKKFSKNLNLIHPDSMIDNLLTLTGKKAIFLLVDDVDKIPGEELKKNVISILGSLQDKSIYNHVIVTTVDYFILHSSPGQRSIEYIYFKPLFDLIKILKSDKKLKNYHQIKLTLYEASVIPRLSAHLYQKISGCTKQELVQYNEELFASIKKDEINHCITSFEEHVKKCYEVYLKVNSQETMLSFIELKKLIIFNVLNISLRKNNTKDHNEDLDITLDQLRDIMLNLYYGDLFKFVIFTGIALETGRPYINSLFIRNSLKINNSVDLEREFNNQIWKPAYHFLKLFFFKFESDYTNFELFMANLDIMYRMFHYYRRNLYPVKKELEKKEIKFSTMFPNAIYLNKSDEKFTLRSEYIINEKFKDIERPNDHVFKDFTLTDWENFLNNSHVFLNCKNGKGFDSVVLDSDNIITFYYDNYNRLLINDKFEEKKNKSFKTKILWEIQKTSQNCQEVFEDILNSEYIQNHDEFIKKGLTWRLVFRTLRRDVKKEQLKDIRVKCITKSYPESIREKNEQDLSKVKENEVNLMLIALNDYEKEFEGIFDLKIKFYRKIILSRKN
jgi:hypothetical protein